MRNHELTVGTERIRFALTSGETDGDLSVLTVKIPAGGGPPTLHRHDPFELYRVRSGELTFYIEGADGAVARTVAGPGTLVPIAGGREHTVRNESDQDAEATVVFSPGEPMERFARAAADGSRSPQRLLALAAEHGIEITRPLETALASEPHLDAGYLTIARFSGDSERLLGQYTQQAATMSAVGRDHGLIFHAAAGTGDGMLIVNLWPSRDGSEAATRDPRRLAVLERTELDPGGIRREHHEVANFEIGIPQPTVVGAPGHR